MCASIVLTFNVHYVITTTNSDNFPTEKCIKMYALIKDTLLYIFLIIPLFEYFFYSIEFSEFSNLVKNSFISHNKTEIESMYYIALKILCKISKRFRLVFISNNDNAHSNTCVTSPTSIKKK